MKRNSKLYALSLSLSLLWLFCLWLAHRLRERIVHKGQQSAKDQDIFERYFTIPSITTRATSLRTLTYLASLTDSCIVYIGFYDACGYEWRYDRQNKRVFLVAAEEELGDQNGYYAETFGDAVHLLKEYGYLDV